MTTVRAAGRSTFESGVADSEKLIMRSAPSPRRSFITALLLGLLGIGFVVWGAGVVERAFATRTWPRVAGSVTASDLIANMDAEDGETLYTARITYRYHDGERSRSGNRISLGDHSSSSSSEMRGLVQRYPVGRVVQVAYDPNAPASALLEPGPVWVTWVPLGFGLLATSLALASIAQVAGPDRALKP